MNNVAEFIKIREQIELHAKEIAEFLGRGTVAEPKLLLDQANGLLAKLASMVDNDIQVTAVGRLTRLLGSLNTKVASMEKKKGTAKRSRPQKNVSPN